MRTLVLCSDKYHWCLRPFMCLWNKYCAIPVTIVGFTPPPFLLLENFDFCSVGSMDEYPVNKWSDALIKVLHEIPDEQILILLEDAWVTRPVNINIVEKLFNYAIQHPEVLRIDLTGDRLYNSTMCDYVSLQWIDLIVTPPPSEYLLSLCAGIWNKSQLLRYLIPGETPWQFEIDGSRRANEGNALVLGTRQLPIRHLFAVKESGEVELKTSRGFPKNSLSDEDIAELRGLNYLNGN